MTTPPLTRNQWLGIVIAAAGVAFVIGFVVGAQVAKHQLGVG
jgi:hypothetical protein